MHRFNAVMIKIPAGYFVDKGQMTLKCIWKGKKKRRAKIIFFKKRKMKKLSYLIIKLTI